MEQPNLTTEKSSSQWRKEWPILLFLIPFLVGLILSTLFGCIFGAVLWIVFTCVGTDRLVVNIGMRSIQFLVLMALFIPMFVQARTKARATTCLSHMKQVTQSTLLYAQDYDGNLPPPLAASSMPFSYIQDRSILVCPDAGNATANYTLNTNLTTVAFHAMAWPEKTILIYESKANTLDYRHNDRAMIGFADGHCKPITHSDATGLFWTPQVPPNLPKPSPNPTLGQPDKAETNPQAGGPAYMR